jgi:hypothetical protein
VNINPILPSDTVGADYRRAFFVGCPLPQLLDFVLVVVCLFLGRALFLAVVRRAVVLLETLQLSEGGIGDVAALLHVGQHLVLDRLAHANEGGGRGDLLRIRASSV